MTGVVVVDLLVVFVVVVVVVASGAAAAAAVNVSALFAFTDDDYVAVSSFEVYLPSDFQ